MAIFIGEVLINYYMITGSYMVKARGVVPNWGRDLFALFYSLNKKMQSICQAKIEMLSTRHLSGPQQSTAAGYGGIAVYFLFFLGRGIQRGILSLNRYSIL